MKKYNIYLSITGEGNDDWKSKLKEVNDLKIEEVAVFLTGFDKENRKDLYSELLKSCIKRIPFVHLRHDTSDMDIEFFNKNFKTKHFNIHENHFKRLRQWEKNLDRLYLELNFDNKIDNNVIVKKIGGFCVDLSHFKASVDFNTIEAEYVFKRKSNGRFICNHLGAYDIEEKESLHYISDLKQFDYLKLLPKFVFGDIIAIEVYESIKDQIKFREYIFKILE